MLPPHTDVFFQYISFLIERKRIDEAEQTWQRMLELRLHFELPQTFPYLDALIQREEVTHLGAVLGYADPLLSRRDQAELVRSQPSHEQELRVRNP
jgi:hypothetical protein